MLAEQGPAQSGKKADLIKRLITSNSQISTEDNAMMVVEDDLVLFEEPLSLMHRMKTPLYGPINMGMAIAVGLAALMLSAVLIV